MVGRKRNAPSSVDALRGAAARAAAVPPGVAIAVADSPVANQMPKSSANGGVVIKWKVEDIKSLKETGKDSETYRIEGIDWRLRCRTERSERTNMSDQFSIYIYCDEKTATDVWYADVISTIRLINLRDETKDVQEKFSYRYMVGQTNSGYASFIPFGRLTQENEGFISNNSIQLEVDILVIKVRGLKQQEVTLHDFTAPIENMSDGVLVIDGKRLHISKQFMALHSPVFEVMFYRGFKEQSQEEIELEDVDYDEFLELLYVLYPCEKAITAATCSKLLKLADRFQIKSVMRRVEHFLAKTDEMQISTRLRWADQYNLFDAQNACLQQIKSIADVNTVKNQRDYILLSDSVRLMISDKQIKMLTTK